MDRTAANSDRGPPSAPATTDLQRENDCRFPHTGQWRRSWGSVIAAYVTGHGFGHTVRTAEVLRAIRAQRPDLALTVVTSTDERVVRRAAGEPLTVRPVTLDVGVVQRDALTLDLAATVAAWRAVHEDYDARVAAEARWLRESGARMVLADIPPIAFDAAAEAGLPAVGLTNFSWDWIYGHLALGESRLREAADQAARAYGHADLLLELPFAGDLSAFPRRERIPLVARRPGHTRTETRRYLGLDTRARIALLTFGGIGVPGFDLATLSALPDFTFLASEGGHAPGNVRLIDVPALNQDGFDYVDLVATADVVVTKPGYGIVSDAIACRTRMVYTDRGDFAEYPVLVEGMSRLLPAVHVPNDDLRAGRLCEPLERVLALPFPDPPDLGGADAAAGRLLEMVG